MTPSTGPLHPHPLIRGCQEACGRITELVEGLTPEQYASPVAGHSAVGAHVRHCLDHFECLFRGLAAGEVDYVARERNSELERDPDRFRRAVDGVLSKLDAFSESDLDRPLRVRDMPAEDAEPVSTSSTVARELVYLSSHCIHHLAIMTLLAEMQGCRLREGIGLAFSTQAHLRETESEGH